MYFAFTRNMTDACEKLARFRRCRSAGAGLAMMREDISSLVERVSTDETLNLNTGCI